MKKLFTILCAFMVLFSCTDEQGIQKTDKDTYSTTTFQLEEFKQFNDDVVVQYNEDFKTDSRFKSDITLSFEERWGNIDYSNTVSVTTIDGNFYTVAPLRKEGQLTITELLVTWKSANEYHTRIIHKDRELTNRTFDTTPITEIVSNFFEFYTQNLEIGKVDSTVFYADLPEGCYEVIEQDCGFIICLKEVECDTGGGSSPSSPSSPSPSSPSGGGSTPTSPSGSPSGPQPSTGGGGGGSSPSYPPTDPETTDPTCRYCDSCRIPEDEPGCPSDGTYDDYLNCAQQTGNSWLCCETTVCPAFANAKYQFSILVGTSFEETNLAFSLSINQEIINFVNGKNEDVHSKETASIYIDFKDKGYDVSMDEIYEEIITVKSELNAETQLTEQLYNHLQNSPPSEDQTYYNYYGHGGLTKIINGKYYHTRTEEIGCEGVGCQPQLKEVWYQYDPTINNWISTSKPTEAINTQDLVFIAEQFTKELLRWNPVLDVESLQVVFTGKNFDGKSSNQYVAGVFILVDVTPVGKVAKGGKVVLKSFSPGVYKLVAKNGDELIRITNNTLTVVNKLAWEQIVNKVSKYKKFNLKEGNRYLSRTQFRELIKTGDVLKVKITNVEQKHLFDDILAGIDSQNKLEELTGAIYKEAGYVTHTFKQIQIGNSKKNGFDGLFIKYGNLGEIKEIVINESKYSGIFSTVDLPDTEGLFLNPANKSTGLPVQMSDEWIQNVINRMQKPTEPQHIRELGEQLEDLWEDSPEIFTKIVSTVDTHTNEFVIAKLGFIDSGL